MSLVQNVLQLWRPGQYIKPHDMGLRSARPNELLAPDVLSTQSVTVTAALRVLSFYGTGSVTLSGASTAGPLAGTGVADRVSLSFTPTAGSLLLTVSGSVTQARLEIAP